MVRDELSRMGVGLVSCCEDVVGVSDEGVEDSCSQNWILVVPLG